MTVVMEGDKITIVRINARSSNNRSAKITTDIFDNLRRITLVRHGANIKTIFIFCIDSRFYFFESWTYFLMEFI